MDRWRGIELQALRDPCEEQARRVLGSLIALIVHWFVRWVCC